MKIEYSSAVSLNKSLKFKNGEKSFPCLEDEVLPFSLSLNFISSTFRGFNYMSSINVGMMHLKYDLYESKILEPQKYLTVKLSETLNTAQKGDIGGHSIVTADLRDRVVQRDL